jgi:hypothetical protein
MDADRRRRFIAWFQGAPCHGDRAKLQRQMGDRVVTKGRLAQYFDEEQPFGERAARSLADRLGLPLDYFEREDGVREPIAPYVQGSLSKGTKLSITQDDVELVAGFALLPPEEQQALRQRMRQLQAHVDRLVTNRMKPIATEEHRPQLGRDAGDSHLGGLEELKQHAPKKTKRG